MKNKTSVKAGAILGHNQSGVPVKTRVKEGSTEEAVMKTLRIVMMLFCGSAGSLFAGTLTLTPGIILRYSFQTDPGAWGIQAPDYLDLKLVSNGSFSPAEPLSVLTAMLYDGNTLLGTYVSPYNTPISTFIGIQLGEWISTTSPNPGFPFGFATAIDFTSMLNGTIQGRIDVTISSGTLSFDFPFTASDQNYPQFLRTTSASSASSSAGIVNASVTQTPEPGTLLTLGAPVLLLMLAWSRGTLRSRAFLHIIPNQMRRLSLPRLAGGEGLSHGGDIQQSVSRRHRVHHHAVNRQNQHPGTSPFNRNSSIAIEFIVAPVFQALGANFSF